MKTLIDLGELTLGSRLKQISDRLFESVDLIYKEQGITLSSRCFPILFLLQTNGSVGITQLAEWLGQAHSSVSQMSNKLIKAGLITSQQDTKDERRRLVELTPEGVALIDTMQPTFDDIRSCVKDIIDETGVNLMSALSLFQEFELEHSLANRIKEKQTLRTQQNVEIIGYVSQYKTDFKRLNVEWLDKYFYVEEIDNQVLSNPEKYIINRGGYIFFARYNNEIVGTAALLKQPDDAYELTKMSVTEKYQNLKIGRLLASRAIQQFKETGAKLLYLESNSKLKPALALYESLGFYHQNKLTDSHYQRADVYMHYNG